MNETTEQELPPPPLVVEPEGVKPELRKVGHRWLDLIIALTAIVLSVISLAVAIGNARTQEKMVAAATWPLLQYGTSNVNDEGERVIVLTVTNTGVGPALVHDAELRYRGQLVKEWPFLLADCCGWSRPINAAVQAEGGGGGYISSRLDDSIIQPGEDRDILMIRRTPANAAVWDRLDQERFKLTLEACYCSVFGECWRSNLQSIEPRAVKRCRSPQGAG